MTLTTPFARRPTHLVSCQFCGVALERANANAKATCFDCKQKRQREAEKKRKMRRYG